MKNVCYVCPDLNKGMLFTANGTDELLKLSSMTVRIECIEEKCYYTLLSSDGKKFLNVSYKDFALYSSEDNFRAGIRFEDTTKAHLSNLIMNAKDGVNIHQTNNDGSSEIKPYFLVSNGLELEEIEMELKSIIVEFSQVDSLTSKSITTYSNIYTSPVPETFYRSKEEFLLTREHYIIDEAGNRVKQDCVLKPLLLSDEQKAAIEEFNSAMDKLMALKVGVVLDIENNRTYYFNDGSDVYCEWGCDGETDISKRHFNNEALEFVYPSKKKTPIIDVGYIKEFCVYVKKK